MLRVLLPLMLAILLPVGAAAAMGSDLGARVAALDLGMHGYVIGARLSGTQKDGAEQHAVSDSYEGTYKFRDGDLFIIAATDDDTILAIYSRSDEADMDGARMMISGLMGLYGEPTVMAHDKQIYWAYADTGKITEEAYLQIKESNTPADILATVKFSSSFELTAEDPDGRQTGAIYYIITSDPLVRQFIAQSR